MAAWRYGDQFGRRRRQHLIGGPSAAAVGGVVVAGPMMASSALAPSVRWNLITSGNKRVSLRGSAHPLVVRCEA